MCQTYMSKGQERVGKVAKCQTFFGGVPVEELDED